MTGEADERHGVLWSARPGCFERQLQRQFRNPLFPTGLQVVTQLQADEARSRDAREAMTFRADLRDLGSSVAAAWASPSALLDLRRRVDHLRIRVIELGGDLAKEDFALVSARDELELGLLRTRPELSETFYEIRCFYERRHDVRSQFFAQVFRRDSPITHAKLIPSLLTEDVATIWTFAQVMDENWEEGVPLRLRANLDITKPLAMQAEKSKNALIALRRAALDHVTKMEARHVEVLGLADKLIALGVGQEYRRSG